MPVNTDPEVVAECTRLIGGLSRFDHVKAFYMQGPDIIDMHKGAVKKSAKAIRDMQSAQLAKESWALALRWGSVAGAVRFGVAIARRYLHKRDAKPRIPRSQQ